MAVEYLSTIFLAVLTITVTVNAIFSTFLARSRTPCPQSYPLVGNLFGFLRNRRRFHDWVAEMLAHAPTSTIQVNGLLGLSHGVCTADPANVHHLLHVNFPNYVKGQRFRGVLRELLGDGIFNADGPLWTAQRKIASHEFSARSLKTFVAKTVADQISNRLIPVLSSQDETTPVDLQDILQKFGFDNVCHVAFGYDPASLSPNPKNSEFVEAFDYAVSVCSSRFMSPLPILWKTKRFLNVGSERKFKEAIRTVDAFATEIIKSREEKLSSDDDDDDDHHQDLLSRFMKSIARSTDFESLGEKRKFLKDIVASFVMAGRDSTSTALTWLFWLISAHPRCADEIRREIAAAGGSSRLDYDGLKTLDYLHAAVSESLRLFPPVPINSRLAVSGDSLPDGTRVGPGWFADYSAYAMGRMERLWGPDCREFRPERWLDGDGAFRPSDPFQFPVFHGGPRTCLGRELAYVQMKAVAAAVISEFDVVAVDGGGCPENMASPPYVLSILLKMRSGFFVKLKKIKISCSNV